MCAVERHGVGFPFPPEMFCLVTESMERPRAWLMSYALRAKSLPGSITMRCRCLNLRGMCFRSFADIEVFGSVNRNNGGLMPFTEEMLFTVDSSRSNVMRRRRVVLANGLSRRRAGNRKTFLHTHGALHNISAFGPVCRNRSSHKVLEAYRLRWQVELAFKRMKSMIGFGHLPKKDPASARAWLHGKLFVSLLAEHLIAAADTFPPGGIRA